jgi:hypothetical protein
MSLKSIKLIVNFDNPKPYRFQYVIHGENHHRLYSKYNYQTGRERWTFTGKDMVEFKNNYKPKIIFLIHRSLKKRKTRFAKSL